MTTHSDDFFSSSFFSLSKLPNNYDKVLYDFQDQRGQGNHARSLKSCQSFRKSWQSPEHVLSVKVLETSRQIPEKVFRKSWESSESLVDFVYIIDLCHVLIQLVLGDFLVVEMFFSNKII